VPVSLPDCEETNACDVAGGYRSTTWRCCHCRCTFGDAFYICITSTQLNSTLVY